MTTCKSSRLGTNALVDAYLTAKEYVILNGYAAEIDWQDGLRFSNISETDFLREAAWVVLSAGMRESVVRKKFTPLTAAFCWWASAGEILRHRAKCEADALVVFAHRRKISAICEIAKRVDAVGFTRLRESIHQGSVDYLATLAFIGPVTRYHLAKNIGLDVVKPDRHLVRIANAAGYGEPHDMCKVVSAQTGDRLSVVDVVIWRFATLEPSYLTRFRARRNDGTASLPKANCNRGRCRPRVSKASGAVSVLAECIRDVAGRIDRDAEAASIHP